MVTELQITRFKHSLTKFHACTFLFQIKYD